ncbi:MAG: hypothetical protein JWQ35_1463, partial [Bacteriovoracaceae bacterium]|nr:hypothetical protein [Bacteriovoracaceae bacterium]
NSIIAGYTPYIINDVSISDGQIFYLPGTAYFREGSGATAGAQSSVCASMTFMADSFVIQNSVKKLNANQNMAFFSSSGIAISDKDPKSFPGSEAILMNDSGNPISLFAQKASNSNLGDTTISFAIEATILPANGSFVIPSVFFDDNSANNGSPISLGTLELQGLVVTAQPFVTTEPWFTPGVGFEMAGYKYVKMSQGAGLADHPPPGINFAVNQGLVPTLKNVSSTNVSVGDAISDLQSQ